ncbi:MAG: hypothetical protein AAGB00_07915 [Planctomycetota bacterium]
MRILYATPVLLLALLPPNAAVASEWGTIRGRFVVEGKPPALEAIVPEKDPFCERCRPVNETVLVGAEGGLRNAVVYVRVKRDQTLDVHPDYAAAAAEPIALTNERCRFSPRVTLLLTGQELVVKNADPTAHNTKFDLLRNDALNSVIAAEKSLTTKFSEAESLPLPVSCNIHPFMRGYVLIRSDPYMAVSGADGRFEITNLPAGEHQFQFWHETGYLKAASFAGGVADRRGRVRLAVPADGALDLGDVRVAAEGLAP